VERAVVRATPPVLAADGVRTPVPCGIVWLCRRDRRHGKPGGLLHSGRAVGRSRGSGQRGPRPAGKLAAGL